MLENKEIRDLEIVIQQGAWYMSGNKGPCNCHAIWGIVYVRNKGLSNCYAIWGHDSYQVIRNSAIVMQ